MPSLKITRELHAEVRETLKTEGIMTTAKIHNLSPQTVSRIKRGRSYIGYKRELNSDHRKKTNNSQASAFIETGTTDIKPRKKGLFARLRFGG